MIEATLQRGKIVLTPKVVVDRSTFSNADRDYTPAQRRVVDARLAKADEAIKKGRTYGPFNIAEEAITFINKEISARRVSTRKTTNK